MSNTEKMVSVPRDLMQDLYEAAQFEADQRRAALGSFRPHVQDALDKIAADAKAILDQPVEQHQGEPVAKLKDGELIKMANKAAPHPTRDNDMFYIAMGRLVEEYYTHADPGEVKERIRKETESYAAEVERLRADRDDLQRYADELNAERCEWERKVDSLRAQLAELTQEDEKREALALSALKLTKEKASLASQNEFLNGQLAEAHALLRDLVSMNVPRTKDAIEKTKALLSASEEPKPEE